MLAVGVTLALEDGHHRIGIQRLAQVIEQATLVLPGLAVAGLFVDQGDADAGHQHRLAAQQVHQLVLRQRRGFEVLGIGPDPHGRAVLAVAAGLGPLGERLDHIAAREHQAGHLALAVAGGLEPRGQRVGHAHADPVQAAGKAVGPALALVELAACVQTGEDEFDHRGFFLGMQAEGNAAAVVLLSLIHI